MRQRRLATRLIALVTAAALAAALPASAQQQPPAQSTLLPPASAPMSLAEFQAISCAAGGSVIGAASVAYIDPTAIFGTITATPLLLLLPVVFGGFTVGCSVGATLGPGFLWVYRHWR